MCIRDSNNYFSSTSPSTTTYRNDTKLAPRTLPIRAYPKKTVAILATFTNQKSKRLPDNSRFTTISTQQNRLPVKRNFVCTRTLLASPCRTLFTTYNLQLFTFQSPPQRHANSPTVSGLSIYSVSVGSASDHFGPFFMHFAPIRRT